jgi:hypothetical protein
MLETADIAPVLESNAEPSRIARALYWQSWRVPWIARIESSIESAADGVD